MHDGPEWGLRLGAPVLRIFAVGSACLMLGACTFLQSKSGLGPADVPFSWVQATPTSEKVWPDAGWWSEFGSAELTGLVAEAQASNLDLVIARARVEQADAQARIVGSSLLPTISARGGANENGSLETAAGKVRTLSANVNVSYELDFWGRNAASARAADQSLRSSVYDQETVALTTIASVASTYFELLSLRDRLRLARLNAANAEKVLVLTEKQFAAGTISKLPVMQQQTLVSSQRAQLASLEQQERQTFSALSILLGKPPQSFSIAGQSLEGVNTPSVTVGLPSELLSRRPDVKASEADLEAAQANLAAARAAYLPSISLTGDAGVASTALAGLLSGSNPAYTIGASLIQNIFRGGELIADNDLKYARREELLASYRKTALTAFADTDTALSAVRTVSMQEKAQAEATKAALESLRISELQYKAGTVDFLTVLSSQQSAYSAQDRMAQLRSERLQAAVALFKSLGGGWKDAP
jgi:multidrug efflux system outer membrane protein